MTLDEAIQRLCAAGVSSPRVDAELLLAHCLGIERSRLSTVDRSEPPQEFDAAVERRANREPLQYILGRAAFRYTDLAVGPGVFIPRPETELLVDAVPALAAAATVVDLCAGSGALAVAIATERPGTRVYAVERSPAALPWLRRNAEPVGVAVVDGDVADPVLLADLHGRADAVVSNPPYVPSRTAVDEEVRADPAEAVFAGPDGLAVIPAVLARAADLLRAGGALAVEHDESHGNAVPELLRAAGVWQDVTAHRDLTGRPRYATAVRAAAR